MLRKWLKQWVFPITTSYKSPPPLTQKPLRIQTIYPSVPQETLAQTIPCADIDIAYDMLFKLLRFKQHETITCCLEQSTPLIGFNKKGKNGVLVFSYFVQTDTPDIWKRIINFANVQQWTVGILHPTETIYCEKITDGKRAVFRVNPNTLAAGDILHKPEK